MPTPLPCGLHHLIDLQLEPAEHAAARKRDAEALRALYRMLRDYDAQTTTETAR